jgi:hypothetical protein
MTGETMNNVLRGAKRSKVVWVNALTVVAGLSAVAGPLTGLLGPQAAAALLVASGVANIILRTLTVESLEDKGRAD